MEVYVGKIKKEINSTKRLNVSSMLKYDLILKNDCNVITPALELKRKGNEFILKEGYNWVYIPDFERYYFINNITFANDIIILSLNIDILATAKDYLLKSSAYVNRSYNNIDNFIADPLFIQDKKNIVIESNKIAFSDYALGGCYVLKVISNEPTDCTPSLSSYIMDKVTLMKLITYIFSSTFYDTVMDGTSDDMRIGGKAFFDPFRYVVSCMWFPVDLDKVSVGSEYKPIKFGWWKSDVNAYALDKTSYDLQTDYFKMFNVTDWTDKETTWTNITANVPGGGEFNIDPAISDFDLQGTLAIDFTSGEGIFTLETLTSVIARVKCVIGVSVQLSSLYKDITGGGNIKKALEGMVSDLAMGGVAASLEIVSGVNAADSTLSVGDRVNDSVNAVAGTMQPSSTLLGDAGNVTALKKMYELDITRKKFTPLNKDSVQKSFGGMCCKRLPLSSCTGFTQISNPEVEANLSSGEIAILNSFLKGGFYIE